MSYSLILFSQDAPNMPLTREVVQDEAQFACAILEAMREEGISFPATGTQYNNPSNVQGNIGEFCAWELGEKRWEKWELIKAQNAGTPWNRASKPGVDILATDCHRQILFVVEVKTSRGNRRAVAGQINSLKNDFTGLFTDDRRQGPGRLSNQVNEIVFDRKRREPEIGQLKTLVGTSPETSPKVHLVGVLLCAQGNTADQDSRSQAFQRLHNSLTKDKNWQSHQCKYYAVEFHDLMTWMRYLGLEVITVGGREEVAVYRGQS